ncbi:MAG: hypothetical protein L0H63_14695 [Nitrococcus sp.]|nr:hypothetical protein [Nitrococcus sp.]
MMQPAGTHSPVLRRAVMRVQSGFYSWDETRQLHYRMHMPDNERFLLERSIFRDLYGVDCRTQDALRTAWDQIPIGDLDAINETLPPWYRRGRLLSQRIHAGRLEPQLDELSSRLFRYEARRWFELLDEFDQQAGAAVYIQDMREETDEQLHFIFSDKSAMARVRLRHFLRDCRQLERDTSELTPLERRESDLLNEYLNAQHRDIARNFNPKVVRMKKRRKVLLHKDAFR